MADPSKTTIGFTGDGGGLFTFQVLWTAAHNKLNVKFIVWNNQSYQILKINLLQYRQEQQIINEKMPEFFSINDPDIKYFQLAQALGVQALRISKPQCFLVTALFY